MTRQTPFLTEPQWHQGQSPRLCPLWLQGPSCLPIFSSWRSFTMSKPLQPGVGLLTNGVSRLQTNESNSTCRPSCHGHTLPPSWSKVCNPTRSGGVYDYHHRVYHGLILSG